MAASSVNCEAAFLNFYAEFERNRKVFEAFEFFESNIFQKPLWRFPLIICLDLGKHPRVSQISFARQGESLEKWLKGCCIASTLDYTELCG